MHRRYTRTGNDTNDDPLSLVSATDVSVVETNSGTTAATFTLTLNTASARSVTVNYATATGTATSGVDFNARSGSIRVHGRPTQPNAVTVQADAIDEPDETFFLNLTAATNATILDGRGQGTIVDNDP